MEVDIHREQAVLTITLNRPDVLNSLNQALREQLGAALGEAEEPSVRAVVITGAGRAFCVGQDLAELRKREDGIGGLLRDEYHGLVLAIRALEKPVIAAVNGPAAGAGLSLACACDIRVASNSAKFVPAFVNAGLVPDSGGSLFIHGLLGYGRAFEWMSTGRVLAASEALDWGLVTEVVEADELSSRASELAAQLAAGPTRAIGLTKRLFERAANSTLEDQLELEAELQELVAETDDFAEGIGAFLEKRKPEFAGK
ncbi:MAG: enoyl-CoA hydratase-related protein [Gaiellaceae bacterium]